MKAKKFIIKNYNFKNSKEISFNYKIEFETKKPLNFEEKIYLAQESKIKDKAVLKKLLEPLAIILGISYYKLYCPEKISTVFKLSKKEADFWHIVYRKGLGEFCYQNKINPNKIAKFPFQKIEKESVKIEHEDKILLGLGGGKDSIVAAKLLKDYTTDLFLVETETKNKIPEEIAKKLNLKLLKVKRKLDPKLFSNLANSYNGHIPISAIYAFLGFFTAAIYKYKYIAVANEYSSNFGNLRYYNQEINHQWSKSIEFEKLFQNYSQEFISSDIKYFSLLRQFYEIRIAKIFSQYKEYFNLFTSCNKSFSIKKEKSENKWCGSCPKCAFVFLILSPFLNKKDLINIFKKNLFNDQNLIPLFKDILGFGKMKPFDCVGTYDESRAAILKSAKKYKETIIVQEFVKKIKNKNLDYVFKTNIANTLPTPFRFLGINNICLIGYGLEGKVNKKYLEKNYPNLKIKILDKRYDKNYLKKQEDFDLAIKSPGIKKDLIKIPYTSATNIFFSKINGLTIGITGTKGKSTTANIIYQILKKANKNVYLLGNIGNPMLELLLKKEKKDAIYVIELSSYMLDDIEYSPNIALLLNLFPDHMNYHGSLNNYYQAKTNISRFQKKDDIFIKFPFNENLPFKKTELPLIGSHNIKNIKAALSVVRKLNIKDDIIKKAILEYNPLPHRIELLGKYKDIYFYDDAISTTPESTIEAVKALKKVDTIFLGGQDRGYNFNNLEKTLKKYKVRNIVIFSKKNLHIIKKKENFNIFVTEEMEKAVKFAYKYTEKNKICLLSTASPSYLLWKNYQEKAKIYKYYINKYK